MRSHDMHMLLIFIKLYVSDIREKINERIGSMENRIGGEMERLRTMGTGAFSHFMPSVDMNGPDDYADIDALERTESCIKFAKPDSVSAETRAGLHGSGNADINAWERAESCIK